MIAVLCVAVLAGWGLDEVTGAVAAAARRAALVACAVPASPCRSWRSARRIDARTPSGTACASPGGSRRPRRTRVRAIRLALAARVAGAGRRGAGAAVAEAARRGSAPPRSSRWRWRWWCSTCSRRAWATTRRSTDEPGGPAGHARDPLPAEPAPGSLRWAAPRGADHAGGADPAERGHALRALRRARLRLPVRGALRASCGGESIAAVAGLQLRVLPRVGRALAARPAGARAARRDRPAPEPARPAAARLARSAYAGPRRARLPQPGARCRARSWSIASRSCDGADAARDAVTAAGLPGARRRGDRAAHRRDPAEGDAALAPAATRASSTTGRSASTSTRDAAPPRAAGADRQLVPGLEGDRRRPRRRRSSGSTT